MNYLTERESTGDTSIKKKKKEYFPNFNQKNNKDNKTKN